MNEQNGQDLREPGMDYWTATDEITRQNGGQGPKCPRCHQVMFPADEHGRFTCMCQLLGGRRRRR